jgi:ankyrin repeat protein
VAELLLESGANANLRNGEGQTPLHLATQLGDCDIMRLLLDRGADVDVQDRRRSTPLHLASDNRNSMTTQLLLRSGANVRVRNEDGRTPLQVASDDSEGNQEIIRLLSDYTRCKIRSKFGLVLRVNRVLRR